MAPLIRLLLEQYGYRWACLIIGALCLHTCISGMLYQPAEWHLVSLSRLPLGYYTSRHGVRAV